MSAFAVRTASLAAFYEERRGTRCFFLALAAVLLCVSEMLLQDPDTHWHIAVGRWIWESRSVPWTDVFSHTFAGADWIAKEWLSQLIFYGAFAAAGWRGVAALTAIVIAASFALLFQWLRCRIHATAALVVTLLAFLLAFGSLLARPHVLVFPILILWTGGLVEAAARGSPPWRLVPLMMLWANLHGSFTIGFALAGILAVEAMLAVPRQQRPAAALRWSVFLAAVVLAACATPYGYRAMWVTATLFGSGEPLPYIIEWQPLRFDWIGILACGMFISLLLGLALRPRENLFRIVVVVLFGYMMLRHQRFLCLFALVAPIVAAGPLARRLPSLAASLPKRRAEVLPRFAAAGFLLAALGTGLLKSPEPSSLTTPAAALREARALGIAGPVYNDYDFGGFLIGQGVSTFIDGRTDQLFLGGFISGLFAAVRAADGTAFATLLDSRGVTWALVKPGSDEVRHLDALPGWRRAYGDATAVVYTRD